MDLCMCLELLTKLVPFSLFLMLRQLVVSYLDNALFAQYMYHTCC